MLTDEQKLANKIAKTAERFKAMSPGNQINDVAKTFQKLVTLRGADEFGMCTCVTCDAAYPYNDVRINAGHFVGRKHRVTIFDFNNCHPQCANCNNHLHGNLAVYQERLTKMIGPQKVEKLLAAKQESVKFTAEDLAEMKIRFLEECRKELKRIEG